MNEAIDQNHETFRRLFDMLGDTPLPSPFEEYGRAPVFLQDFYMNFRRFVWSDGYLDVRTKTAIALAVSLKLQCKPWSEFFTARMRALGFPEQGGDAVRAIVATCEMYNTFYKFAELSGHSPFVGMAVGLRGHSLGGTVLDAKVAELTACVISALNSCSACTAGHIAATSRSGVSDDAILEAIRCGATMVAGCSFLNSL